MRKLRIYSTRMSTAKKESQKSFQSLSVPFILKISIFVIIDVVEDGLKIFFPSILLNS